MAQLCIGDSYNLEEMMAVNVGPIKVVAVDIPQKPVSNSVHENTRSTYDPLQ